jgi:curved DNA-binding protein CbpA
MGQAMEQKIDDNHYGLLGLAPDAGTDEIRHAYRRLASRYHPDHNPRAADADRFIALTRAYEVLNDPVQRALYDRLLLARATPVRTPPVSHSRPVVRHGILELSSGEARRLKQRPMSLTDGWGRAISLPAGAGHGDSVTVRYDGALVTLTISVRG